MSVYLLTVYLHILAAIFFVGYVLCMVTMVGPIVKMDARRRIPVLREIRLKFAGLGWAAFLVLVATGISLLSYRGATWAEVTSGHFFLDPFVRVVGAKLLVVAVIAGCEGMRGPENSTAVWSAFLATLLVLALSVVLVRAPGILGW